MPRSVIAEPNIEEYLNKLIKLPSISVGLVIGQPGIQSKDYVVHLTRTPKDDSQEGGGTPNPWDDFLVSNHALNVIRMLPAGFYIMGVFVVSPANLFEDTNFTNQVKIWISEIKNIFVTYKLLHGSSEELDNGEMLIVHYNCSNKSVTCRTYEDKHGKQSMRPADWKFQAKPTNWTLIEAYYELDALFPIIRMDDKFNMEENFGSSLDKIGEQITSSIVFFDNKHFCPDETVDTLLKTKKEEGNEKSSIQATVYYPCSEIDGANLKIVKYDGTVHYHGMIASRIYAHPKNNFKDLEKFVKLDIIRSLSARIQIHCDALIENDHIENHIIINEPPRRIFFPIKPNQIQFSDYIFREEDDKTVIKQAKENLDIDLIKSEIQMDIETPPSDSEQNKPSSKSSEKTANLKVANDLDKKKKQYVIGIILSLVVLMISIFIKLSTRVVETTTNEAAKDI